MADVAMEGGGKAAGVGWRRIILLCVVVCEVWVFHVSTKTLHDPRVQQKTLFVYSGLLLFVQQIEVPRGEFICATNKNLRIHK